MVFKWKVNISLTSNIGSWYFEENFKKRGKAIEEKNLLFVFNNDFDDWVFHKYTTTAYEAQAGECYR
jgi:hypothetical protein